MRQMVKITRVFGGIPHSRGDVSAELQAVQDKPYQCTWESLLVCVQSNVEDLTQEKEEPGTNGTGENDKGNKGPGQQQALLGSVPVNALQSILHESKMI